MEARLGPYQLEVATRFGPRITSLRRDDGPEMLANLGSDVTLDHESGSYAFRGGHRLWASPEVPSITYSPDDHDCSVSLSDNTLSVTAPPDAAGLVKEIRVSLDDDALVLDHAISGVGGEPVLLAAWAISQLPLGGTAILPLVGDNTAPSPNRYLVVWPYTSIEDHRVTLRDDVLEVSATDGPQLKFGGGPTPRRLGYIRDGYVFIKEIESAANRVVPDFGAAGQIYVGQGFCELESVGALTELSDGVAAVLRERWMLEECPDLDSAIERIVAK